MTSSDQRVVEDLARAMRSATGVDSIRTWEQAGPAGQAVWLHRAQAQLPVVEHIVRAHVAAELRKVAELAGDSENGFVGGLAAALIHDHVNALEAE